MQNLKISYIIIFVILLPISFHISGGDIFLCGDFSFDCCCCGHKGLNFTSSLCEHIFMSDPSAHEVTCCICGKPGPELACTDSNCACCVHLNCTDAK